MRAHVLGWVKCASGFELFSCEVWILHSLSSLSPASPPPPPRPSKSSPPPILPINVKIPHSPMTITITLFTTSNKSSNFHQKKHTITPSTNSCCIGLPTPRHERFSEHNPAETPVRHNLAKIERGRGTVYRTKARKYPAYVRSVAHARRVRY